MRRINYFAMSLLASAALAFTGCSSEDVINGGTEKNDAADGFYMTLTVKTPQANQTRTSNKDRETEPGTAEETTITKGTFYLCKGTSVIYTKSVVATDWVGEKGVTADGTGTTKPIKVSVNNVNLGDYDVYFLAGDHQNVADPLNAEFSSEKGGSDYAADGNFVMFNQNDSQRAAAHGKVTFTEASKNEATPAQSGEIYLDRTVARVDAPSANVTTISKGTGTNEAKTKNVDAVKSIDFISYAVANLSNRSFVMQNWSNEKSTLVIPASNGYYKAKKDFGDTYNNAGEAFFGNEAHNYMFENTVNTEDDATSMYFCYTATLDDSKLPSEQKDFTDGTFYRYDKKIYTSLQQIWDDSSVAWPFVYKDTNTKMTVAEALALIKENGNLKAQADLAQVREKYGIDIYEGGKMYYKTAIQDEKYHPEGYFSILRNSVYKLTVNHVYDLGKDVPNGPDPDAKNKNYYMQVTVVVNNWVVNKQNVDLK